MTRVLLCLVLVGCVDSSSVQCGFGLCPQGSTCDETGKRCIPPTCGNGAVEQPLEQCDGTLAGEDCTSVAGYYNPAGLACSADCTFDTSACGGGQCGDDKVNGPELCDGLPPIGASCIDFGYDLGKLGCTIDCSIGVEGCYRIGWHAGQGTSADELRAIWGANQVEMWGVGDAGHILKGNGTVWGEVASPTTNNLTGIWGTSAKDIYAVGEAGTILHYDGTAWTTITSPTTQNLNAINGTATDIWIVGDAGTILHSPTGTVAWSAETSGVTVNLHSVWAQGAMTAVAVGDAATTGTASPTALYRNNTGVWTATTTPAINPGVGTATLNGVWGNGAAFIAVGNVAVASGHGIVLQLNLATSTTWGFTGQSLSPNELKSVWGVVTNRIDIYIGGLFGTLLHYTGVPGAAHFYQYNSNTTRSINGLWGTGPAFVRGATASGEVQEYNGTDLSSQDLSSSGIAALQGNQMNAVWTDPSTGNAIAVGAAGYISKHDNTGWSTPTQVGSGGPWNAVWGSGTTIALGGGNTAQGLRTSTDGGATWPTAAVFTQDNWQALWGTSATDIYAVGAANTVTGVLAHFNGATWSLLTLPANTNRLDGIWGTSDSDIFVVGYSGTILHYNGSAWTPQPTNTTARLLAVWGSTSNDVYAVGDAGTILHYDGTTWHKLTSGTAQDLYAVGGSSRADIFAAGRGVVLHSSGLGAFQPMEAALADIYGISVLPDAIYFAGDVATAFSTNAGVALLLRTTLGMVEGICNDPWDNDVDGKVDCADEDCADTFGCKAGGTCAPAKLIACGATESANTYTGIARIDDLPCLDHSTPGPEAAYRLLADHDGTITVTIDSQTALDLVVLNSWDDQSVTTNRRIACDVTHCTAAASATGSRNISFVAKAGEVYYLLVDGPLNTADAFTLDVSCP